MPVKRKRAEDAGTGTTATGKPLSAIATARLRAEAAAKGIITPELTHDPVPAPSSPTPGSIESGYGELEAELEDEEAHLQVERNFKLCSWRNDSQDILSNTHSELTINLNKHATIALIGCFKLKVLRGAVNINGANIGTVNYEGQKNNVHRVSVSAAHPILKIRGLDGTNHVQFLTCKIPTPLTKISPLFEDIWHTNLSNNTVGQSFSIITESNADPLSRTLSPEVIPEGWLRAVEDCTSSSSITLVVGASNMGKSTFAKRLLNRYLTGLGKIARPASAACYLDLDPNKQEYTPIGQISLVLVRDLNLGPSFTHPSTVPGIGGLEGNETLRAHPIPVNLANYMNFYLSCVEDLFLVYKHLQSRDALLPLIINTPGSLHDSHFAFLTQLLAHFKPHNIIHLGDTQTLDTGTTTKLHSLQTLSSYYRSTVHEIAAISPLSTPVRTEAEISAMHMQSYFHLKTSNTKPDEPQVSTWTAEPLSHLVPWEFCYHEKSERLQDFVGFAMYTEPIEPTSLLHALNGSIVHIVESTSSIIPTPYTDLPRAGRYQIPYFPKSKRKGMVEPLDPRTSKVVCAAMIRGFDPEKKVVQVLVPKTHETLLYNLSPERTVFVGGCCDTPEWAYLEDAYMRAETRQDAGSASRKEKEEELLWTEKRSSMEETGYLHTVRRVRKFQT